ncbi:hypothetical protein [Bacillus phage vB_BceS-M2]
MESSSFHSSISLVGFVAMSFTLYEKYTFVNLFYS